MIKAIKKSKIVRLLRESYSQVVWGHKFLRGDAVVIKKGSPYYSANKNDIFVITRNVGSVFGEQEVFINGQDSFGTIPVSAIEMYRRKIKITRGDL